MPSRADVDSWIERCVHAWTTSDRNDLAALFTSGAEYHEWPYETHWIGRDDIIEGRQDRADWQCNGWTFAWDVLMITGGTAAVRGLGTYPEFGVFGNLWTLTFAPDGRGDVFRRWNNAAPD
ncbi:hypothetical protein GCM10027445_30650 [Amycolatopsis endophytica]|uniref:SnoaL-like domain-containing protein n=1 Tax=Amycolatopsis endophytica TaxID=860233 RepID=A0A853BA36_9PSEU|nr:nuclear transport factor 2 family protein [Amycolatopsis endophytica]NYI91840.1 hypothetical protein [Amycolatopsis endophytica]